MVTLCEIQSQDEKRALAISDIARMAAEATHCAFMAKAEVDEVKAVVAAGKRSLMWEMLQTKIAQYRGFIVGVSPFTNITVTDLPKEVVSKLTDASMRNQLKILIGYVYAYHAMFGTFRMAFQECFSKMLRSLYCK